MDRREELIKSATDFITVIDDFSKEFQEDAIPLMADFTLLTEQAVIRRIVGEIQRLHGVSHKGGCGVCRYIAKLKEEITDAGK